MTEETRRKLSEAHKGKPSGHKGHHHSEESKRKISEANKNLVKVNVIIVFRTVKRLKRKLQKQCILHHLKSIRILELGSRTHNVDAYACMRIRVILINGRNFHGGILKRFKRTVLKTVRPSNRCGSSNLSTSAKYIL